MLEIENFRSISKIKLKESQIIAITGDNYTLLNDICHSFDYYFNGKKLLKTDKDLNEGKLIIKDLSNDLKKNVSSISAVIVDSSNFFQELELGSKTKLYDIFNNLFKEKIAINPVLITINSLFEDLEIDDSFLEIKKELSKYSDTNIEIRLNKFISSDLVKKVEISILENEEDINPYYIRPLEKIKLQLAISSISNNINNYSENRIYVFPFPESNMSSRELSIFKDLIFDISKEHTVMVATFSKEILSHMKLDNINIIIDNELKNEIYSEDIIELLYNNYPILKDKEYILKKLNFVTKHFLNDALYGKLISNKELSTEEYLFIENFENIFTLLYFLKLSNIKYLIDLEYDNSSIFSNYIKANL